MISLSMLNNNNNRQQITQQCKRRNRYIKQRFNDMLSDLVWINNLFKKKEKRDEHINSFCREMHIQ